MNFLGKQTLAANFSKTLCEIAVALSADLVLLKRPHVTQDGAEARQTREECPRLPERQRRGARANPEREFALTGGAGGMRSADGFRRNLLKGVGRQDGSIHGPQL
ncbi:hypothetical protein Gbth_043_033 [Gluconobacter thailandicus F149-1 = NBRC 100600]|nr:hypothetical protein Gbth_043_033 [Gluconobacter thailandicus F149-1 = NBRC 100600]GEL86468.1 hypothetical protein GTH01_08260 [Gluconobacter thailandicus F149-1 = NBRC 100600]